MDMPGQVRQLQAGLGHRFADPALLERALRHRSLGARNNERLEFLGDGLLNFVIASALYAARPDAPEGDLSRLRATLVREATLADVAQELRLGDLVELGEGERASGGHRRSSIRADALEAVLGAIYLDAGFDVAAQVIRRLWAGRIEALPDAESLKDPKTRLQEWLQGRGLALPEYALETVTGPAHKQQFTASCTVGAHVSRGTAGSRRKAEQAAARAALTQLEQTDG